MAKIVIEIDGQRYEFEGEAEFTQEHGLKTSYDTYGNATKIEFNGHRRIILKAWSGCNSFDTFEAKTIKG